MTYPVGKSKAGYLIGYFENLARLFMNDINYINAANERTLPPP